MQQIWETTQIFPPKSLSGKSADGPSGPVAASHTSELHALDLRFRAFNPESVLFKLSSLTKKRKVEASLKECFFDAFKEDGCLCIMECMREYEKRTLEFRNQCPKVPDPLFLSYVCPHKLVTSQRIAHWIKDCNSCQQWTQRNWLRIGPLLSYNQ